jgi:ABC-type dipeptide/oligopeptide/nickel transport system permease component/Zn-dependent M28 family amino/carboxypeptidase
MSTVSKSTTSSNAFALSPGLRALLRRLGISVVILLAIAYLTLFGLMMAERGRKGLPAEPLRATIETLSWVVDYLVGHPTTYYWHREDVSALGLVIALFGRSAGLLLLALCIATVVGVPLGIAAALLRRIRGAPPVLLISVLGISTPSFLLAMLFWMLNIQISRLLGLDKAPLPPAGFGWDVHMVMPALVLATRPLAQIVQITYISMSDVLREDYIRTAQAKGLAWRVVINRHALRNVLIPILTTLGTSLRFSLASLPVVECFFAWPGVGLALLQAIELEISSLVTDLIVSLGFLFLLINLALEVIYQIVDPRLRDVRAEEHRVEQPEGRAQHTWQERLADLKNTLADWWADLRQRLLGSRRKPSRLSPRPVQVSDADSIESRTRSAWRHIVRSFFGNPALLIGMLLVLAFCGLALFGERWTEADPSETHGAMIIEGQIDGPPFRPSSVFPWGSDHIGRDVQALVLTGAKRTLTLALAGTLARVLLGTVLGVLAGWWRGGWFDRLVTALVAVWAAFPVTLFAMILILALGIQQGKSVFIVALCVVGWGEIAQFVRGQVIRIKPELYIDAARAVGARSGRILTWHVLPHLLAPLLVLTVLEIGGVLMLLAELGFLNIFLGGGFKVELFGEQVSHFSDVPEWGALLANIRDWWRSYPWMAWYPGVAFFVAILAFNLWGEGLRRFLDEARINLSRLMNRYTIVAIGALVLGVVLVLRSTAPVALYRSQAQAFDAQRALEDIRVLSSSQFQGRETGTPGANLAAEYIAGRMERIGLFPAGENETYTQTLPCPRFHLVETPRLEVLDTQGGVAEALIYRQHFVEYVYLLPTHGEGTGAVVGLALGPDPEMPGMDPYGLGNLDLGDKVVIMHEADMTRVNVTGMAGVLFISDDPLKLQHKKYLFGGDDAATLGWFPSKFVPVMYITPETANRLLITASSSLAELNRLTEGLQPGRVALTDLGTTVRLKIVGEMNEDPVDECHNVIGFIPGTGAAMGPRRGEGLDDRVILVSANYDGLGIGPSDTFYPGANDNASGVAAMLEMARILKESPVQPKKTVVFAAWSGGERGEGLSVTNVMGAKIGFSELTVEAVIELSGVATGDGQGIALGQGTSFRLVQLYQEAADRLSVSTTTRGRGPQFGMFTRPGFGGRSALTAYVSWDGSDRTAHTSADTIETIDPDKMRQVGQATLLVVSVLGQAAAEDAAVGPLSPADDYVHGAAMFDEEQAMKHVEYLASDELGGRRPGSPGGRAAGDYIAAHFTEYGLEPAGTDDTCFQPFTTPITTLVELPVLTVIPPPGQVEGKEALTHTYAYRADYIAHTRRYLGPGEARGQVVWLNECGRKDFAGQDIPDKIVLCHHPRSLDDLYKMIEQAREHQVGGLLLLVQTGRGPEFRYGYVGIDPETIPAYAISEVVAQDLLIGSDYALDDLVRPFTATPLSTTVHMRVTMEEREVEARNVLGMLPGSDPEHRDEIVIVGAHYDHMGTDPDGAVYNGANDNAAGVAAVLEIARLWHMQGFRPARSVLFIAWDDHERGRRRGSQYYVQHPIYPLDQTVAVLNLDVIGVGDEVSMGGEGAMAAQLQASARVYSVTVHFDPSFIGEGMSFAWEAGVPAGNLAGELDPAYHTTYDDAQNINPAILRTIGVLSTHTLAAWSGGGPGLPLPTGRRYLWDWIIPTPTCGPSRPPGAMICDHGEWRR